MSLWCDESTNVVKAMYREGKSARQILVALAEKGIRHLTRSAVQGKVHRLGLTRSPEAHKETMAMAQKSREPKPKPDKAGSKPAIKTVYEPTIIRIDQRPLVTSRPVGVEEARPIHCRWPIKVEGIELFCGADIERGSFCVHHARVAYTRDE